MGSKLLLIQEEAPKEYGGILLSEAHTEKPNVGRVISVGNKCKFVKVNDKIAYAKYSGVPYEDYIIIEESDILVILDNKDE